MKLNKGFTLIELMVVIVIIGILSALAIPKMFGVSAKAKAAEAPGVIANFEVLASAYSQETGVDSLWAVIGFKDPTASSKWFTYTSATSNVLTATVKVAYGGCTTAHFWSTTHTPLTDSYAHALPAVAACAAYTPNF